MSDRTSLLALALAGLLVGCPAAPDDDDATAAADDNDATAPPGFACDVETGNTVGLLRCRPGAAGGYTLIAPFGGSTTWLVDPLGRVVHRWESSWGVGLSAYLLDDGTLVRGIAMPPGPLAGNIGLGGGIEALSWDGEQLWEYAYNDETIFRHHDIEPMPGGTVLLVAYEARTRAEAIAAGRDPALLVGDALWPDHLVEIDPKDGAIVWEWHVWDHLVQDFDPAAPGYGDPASNPEKLDINAVLFDIPASDGPDWNHMNSVSYDPVRDEITMTVLMQSEVWVIPRQGDGDFVWRWGNDRAWGGEGSVLQGPHDGHRIGAGLPGAGNLLVFNNSAGEERSAVLEIAPRMDGEDYARDGASWSGADVVWSYEAPDFHSRFASASQRVPGGNTVITESATGRVFEVTPGGETVWEYINPVTLMGVLSQGDDPSTRNNPIFRAPRYPADHPALVGRDLTPGDPIEQ
jgi:hypothetical protein